MPCHHAAAAAAHHRAPARHIGQHHNATANKVSVLPYLSFWTRITLLQGSVSHPIPLPLQLSAGVPPLPPLHTIRVCTTNLALQHLCMSTTPASAKSTSPHTHVVARFVTTDCTAALHPPPPSHPAPEVQWVGVGVGLLAHILLTRPPPSSTPPPHTHTSFGFEMPDFASLCRFILFNTRT
jgi:hypothetical protein